MSLAWDNKFNSQASPRPYLHASFFDLCEGPGILRVGSCGQVTPKVG